jgi:hypothetical protein
VVANVSAEPSASMYLKIKATGSVGKFLTAYGTGNSEDGNSRTIRNFGDYIK